VSPFASAVLATIRQRALLPRGGPVVCGVSGGADSIALLRVLLDLAGELRLAVTAAHLDHALRPDSADDEAFVREWAVRWNVPLVTERLDWDARGGAPAANREAAARDARYGFLLRVARERGAVPAVGHHATDRLETFLAQLLRGAGPRGLSLPRARREDGVIRPLFDRTAGEVRDFLRARGIPWREDPTNRDGSNLRARLRSGVLPALRRENPELERTVGRTADLLAAVEAHLEAGAEGARRALERPAPRGEIALDGPGGRPYDAIILATVLRSAVRRLGGNPAEIGFDTIESSVRAWREGRIFAADVPGALRISVRTDGVRIGRSGGSAALPVLRERAVPVPGEVSLPEIGAHLTVEAAAGPPVDPAGTSGPQVAWVDADSLRGELRLRSRRPGDRYRPIGRNGSVKVQDLMVDRKIPRALRGTFPVLFDGGGIVWVAGFRVDARARITEETKRALRLELTGARPFFQET
jgi:tRNA(Ile)-lysidine synthase